ncbi:MAG TPA: sensor histidine kinase [Acidisarcina sp.]
MAGVQLVALTMRTAGQMKSLDAKHFDLDPSVKLTFVLLVGLILGGNVLLIWQFHIGQVQAERVTRVSGQMASVLRLQGSLLSFHQRLSELAQSKNASLLKTESVALQDALFEQVQQTRNTLTPLQSETKVDPLLLPTLDAIEIGLPAQLDAITDLASVGDWNAVSFRIDERLNPFEIEAAALVKSVDQDFAEELSRSQSNMKSVQDRIYILVPATAIYTFVVATFFAWAIARKILHLRFEARVNERTRIARDLHDTLLQSFHGLLLHLQTASSLLPMRPEQAKQRLDSSIDKADQAIAEAMDAVRDLRSSSLDVNDLADTIRASGEELSEDVTDRTAAAFRAEVEGRPRELHPILRDEVYRIAIEAMRNAFRHSGARQIEVGLRYDGAQFRLRIRDDGKGIDRRVLARDGRAGHFGLAGMRERAKIMGGKLTIWSEHNSGTEVELIVPASIAYASSSTGRHSWLSDGLTKRSTGRVSAEEELDAKEADATQTDEIETKARS